MNILSSKVLTVAVLTAGLVATTFAIQRSLLLVPDADASSPEAWQQHNQEVTRQCLESSGLRQAQPAGNVIVFDDQVGYDALLLRGTYPQPHMNNQTGQELCLFNRQTRQAHISEADTLSSQPTQIYRSDRAGFQFTYPGGYVAQVQTAAPGSDRALEQIDIWTAQHYNAVKSPTPPPELPANVRVAVLQNPRSLSLQDWAKQNDRFALPKNFRPVTVAGQPGIAFDSTGLYEHENVVVAIPQSTAVLVLDLAKIGVADHEAAYRPVFQQVLSSLEFKATQ